MNANILKNEKKRIVIAGGGFGGLTLAKLLKNSGFQIVLLDRTNYHQFQPLLYQVATAGLNPSSIAFPFRKDFRRYEDFHFRMTEVTRIDPEGKKVETTIGNISYDYLILATGTDTNYFGMENIKANALPMKSVAEALALRNTLLMNLEQALTSDSDEERQRLLNIVIVGGGPTGVEISGAISEMKRYVIAKDYPDLGNIELNIYLIEGSPKLLGVMSEESSAKALQFLKEMGVKVMLNTKVTDYKDSKAMLSDGTNIPTTTLIWVSGVTASYPAGIPAESIGRGNRIKVDAQNRVNGFDDIFAIGDIALQTEADYPNGHPQVAQVAIQQGRLLAKNFTRAERHQPEIPFHYKNKGSMATVGRNRAVVDLRSLSFQGLFAWFIWMLIHLMSILGVRNKLEVLLNWIWNYVTYDQALRLIIRQKEPRKTGN